MSHAIPQKGQRTLDAILTRTPPSVTGEPPAKRRRSSIDTAIDVHSYREDGQVSTRGRKEINRHLLKTLGKDENPITNSDLYDRTAHVVTCATDVRQNIARSGAKFYQSEKEYFAERHRKLGEQFRGKRADGAIADEDGEEEIQLKRSSTSRDVKQTFAGFTFWINGYTGPRTTAMELQRRIITHGGNIRFVLLHFTGQGSRLIWVGQESLIDSRDVTHIVVHKELPARKAVKIGKSSGKGVKKVVDVDWVLDCIADVTKRNEGTYTGTRQHAQATLDGSSVSNKTEQGSSVPSGGRAVFARGPQAAGNQKREVEVICIDDDD
ncbi:hypothetical protein QFC20_002624 [Naganishia adeliensis]|uniref:Uncharacterized protein n=1 Tax=Naganishia adeliensis TaxID=92952 RepID=A0ACC2WIV5_9TREE|nr:hypothetical protein QFC20_002624 [Naganishia adeliensis]